MCFWQYGKNNLQNREVNFIDVLKSALQIVWNSAIRLIFFQISEYNCGVRGGQMALGVVSLRPVLSLVILIYMQRYVGWVSRCIVLWHLCLYITYTTQQKRSAFYEFYTSYRFACIRRANANR